MEVKEKITKINQLIDELNDSIPDDLSSIPDAEFSEMIGLLEEGSNKLHGIIDSICDEENPKDEDENE